MINLIPNEEKKEMKKVFYLRFVAVVFFMLSVCILITTVLMLPSYFVSVTKKNLVNNKLEMQLKESIPQVDQKAITEIEELRKKLSLLENFEKEKFLVSEKVIDQIIDNKMSDIKIEKINYENDPIKGKKISLNGTAPSRERLLLFRKALEDDPLFTKVDLPISNFIKGSDIRFFLSLNFK